MVCNGLFYYVQAGMNRRMNMETINWYPGHMKKTRDLILTNMGMVDASIEVIDARIPVSSRNPVINELVKGKPRIIVLNKSDLSDEDQNQLWKEKLSADGTYTVVMNCTSGSVKPLLKTLERVQRDVAEAKKKRQEEAAQTGKETEKAPGAEKHRDAAAAVKRQKPLRVMIVGIPNVGKSSLINRLTNRKSARTGNKPGVTRGKQWLTLKNGMQLLDTPGILWPKLEDPETGLSLAFCGSIKDEILDIADLGLEFIKYMQNEYPQLLCERYRLEQTEETPLATMEEICRKRGFIMPGKRIDYDRCARTVLDEFRAGKIGRITLEKA